MIVPCGTEVSLINDIDLLNGYDEIIDYVKNTTNLDNFLKPTQISECSAYIALIEHNLYSSLVIFIFYNNIVILLLDRSSKLSKILFKLF